MTSFARSVAVLGLIGMTSAASSAGAYEFDDTDFLAPTDAWPEWHEAITRAMTEQQQVRACLEDKSACTGKLRSLRVVIHRGRALSRHKQMQLVNRYINNHRRYRGDRRRDLETRTGIRLVRQQWSTLSLIHI